MVLRMPDGVLSLGMHLDAPAAEVLASMDQPDLIALMKSIEPAAGVCEDCGATDWAALPQRMHYIFHLFRAFHEKQTLFDPPFSEIQIEAIRAGVIPKGRL